MNVGLRAESVVGRSGVLVSRRVGDHPPDAPRVGLPDLLRSTAEYRPIVHRHHDGRRARAQLHDSYRGSSDSPVRRSNASTKK